MPRSDVSTSWITNGLGDKVCVFQNKTKKYTLQPSEQGLQHENDYSPIWHRLTIVSDPESDANSTQRYEYASESEDDVAGDPEPLIDNLEHPVAFAMKPSRTEGLDQELEECVFIALGWLVEHEALAGRTESKKRTTNYMVLLNLSTNPISVWLIYDYHMQDFVETWYRWTNRLGDYHNGLMINRGEERFVSEVQDEFEVVDDSRKNARLDNFQKLYTNIEEMRPKDGFPLSPLPSSHSPTSTTDDTKGYFGLPPFDFALLASDIDAWSVNGLDQKHVKQCLDGSSVRLGSSLRVKTANEKQTNSLCKERIDISNLRS